MFLLLRVLVQIDPRLAILFWGIAFALAGLVLHSWYGMLPGRARRARRAASIEIRATGLATRGQRDHDYRR